MCLALEETTYILPSEDIFNYLKTWLVSARKRSLGQGNIFTGVFSVYKGGGRWWKEGVVKGGMWKGCGTHLQAQRKAPPRPRGRHPYQSQGQTPPPPPPAETANEAGGTYPTGMHSCLVNLNFKWGKFECQTGLQRRDFVRSLFFEVCYRTCYLATVRLWYLQMCLPRSICNRLINTWIRRVPELCILRVILFHLFIQQSCWNVYKFGKSYFSFLFGLFTSVRNLG